MALASVCFKQMSIVMVVSIHIQHTLPWCHDPFSRHGDELDDKRLDSAIHSQAELLSVLSQHDSLVEVPDESCHEQENSILRHERLRQVFPSETVVHVIEGTLHPSTEIVELHNVPCAWLMVICLYAPVDALSLPGLETGAFGDWFRYARLRESARFAFLKQRQMEIF